MNLGQLIQRLRQEPSDKIVPLGFYSANSYRGYYEDLAFAPARNVTVGEMLRAAEEANGETYHGWKGGDYVMDLDSTVWLAEQGHCGETLGPVLLDYMLGKYNSP